MTETRQHVLIIPDGAGERRRLKAATPLEAARLPGMDFLAREGFCGRAVTLYPDLPRGSLVAHLGILGWNPYRYHPHGRASAELLALDPPVPLAGDDLVFRANLVRMEGAFLASYSADGIESERARPLIERVNAELADRFPEFELYHNLDFRATLVLRRAQIDARSLRCLEPHEVQGAEIALDRLVTGCDEAAEAIASRISAYVAAGHRLLAGEPANLFFPWSPSQPLLLSSFREQTGFEGEVAVVAAMDFLHGIARAAAIESHRVGNGRLDTDYAGKGRCVLDLLEAGRSLVVCHVNAPDEAAHMQDPLAKVAALEQIDLEIVQPVVQYFRQRPGALGSVVVIPDHYTNSSFTGDGDHGARRVDAHSLDPVPFAIWDGRRCDEVDRFSEAAAAGGLYGAEPVSHLDLLGLMGARVGLEVPC